MTNITAVITGVILMALMIMSCVIIVFHFWIFPTGLEVLRGFDFVSVSESFAHALYWFVVGIIVLGFVRSIKVQFGKV